VTDWHRAPNWPKKSGYYQVVCNDNFEYTPEVWIYYYQEDGKIWRDETGEPTTDYHIPLGWAERTEAPAWAWMK
jgi:hypothetical protein